MFWLSNAHDEIPVLGGGVIVCKSVMILITGCLLGAYVQPSVAGNKRGQSPQDKHSILGRWSGKIVRPGYGQYATNMDITATEVGAWAGTADYPKFRCGGKLRLNEKDENRYRFRIKLERGKRKCEDGTDIQCKFRKDGNLRCEYFDLDGKGGVFGNLRREKGKQDESNEVVKPQWNIEASKGFSGRVKIYIDEKTVLKCLFGKKKTYKATYQGSEFEMKLHNKGQRVEGHP